MDEMEKIFESDKLDITEHENNDLESEIYMDWDEIIKKCPDCWVGLSNFKNDSNKIEGVVKFVCRTEEERSNVVKSSEKMLCWLFTSKNYGKGIIW